MKPSLKHQEPTNKELIGVILKIIALFIVTVLLLAGVDLIDQIMLWIY